MVLLRDVVLAQHSEQALSALTLYNVEGCFTPFWIRPASALLERRQSGSRANVAQSDVATEWEQRYFREQRKLAYSAELKQRHQKIRYSGKTNPSLVLRFAIATIHRIVASPLVRFRMQR